MASIFKHPCRSLTISHFKIIFFGISASTIISALYSSFAHVQTLNPIHQTKKDLSIVIYGLTCDPMDFPKANTTVCDQVTKHLYYNTTNPEYHCNSDYYSDFSSKTLYDFNPFLWTLFLLLCVFSAIFGVYAIIHDLSGIHYKHNLKSLVYFPDCRSEYFHLTNKLLVYLNNHWQYTDESVYICICWLFVCILMLILIPIDLIVICIVHPMYISAFMVGWSRFSMSYLAIFYVFSSYFLNIAVHQDINTKCDCRCYFYLNEKDAYSCLFASIALIILNTLFLKSWFYEGRYKTPFFYLVSYKLPFIVAKELNEDNMASGYDYRIEYTVLNLNVKHQNAQSRNNINDRNNSHEAYQKLEISQNDTQDITEQKQKQESCDDICCDDASCRTFVYCIGYTFPIPFIFGATIWFFAVNDYGYSSAIVIAIISVTSVICCAWCVYAYRYLFPLMK